jgi:hypothetical protein
MRGIELPETEQDLLVWALENRGFSQIYLMREYRRLFPNQALYTDQVKNHNDLYILAVSMQNWIDRLSQSDLRHCVKVGSRFSFSLRHLDAFSRTSRPYHATEVAGVTIF